MDRYYDHSWQNVLAHYTFAFGAMPKYHHETALPDWSIGAGNDVLRCFPVHRSAADTGWSDQGQRHFDGGLLCPVGYRSFVHGVIRHGLVPAIEIAHVFGGNPDRRDLVLRAAAHRSAYHFNKIE
jgi:hypothetical protein